MGGVASGRWGPRWDSKSTVEESFSLDINELTRDKLLTIGTAGSITWKDGRTGDILASAFFSNFQNSGGQRIFQISHRLNDSEEITIAVRLQTTFPFFGGRRFWFECPLIVDGVPCERRVAKLHLPPGERLFGCRLCHDLAYQSSQEAHKQERRAAWLERLLAASVDD